MAINHGSIEVFDKDGNNYGVPITPLYPFNDGVGEEPAQVKARTGVTLGAMENYPNDPAPSSLHRGSQWKGTSPSGKNVTVRIWKTAD